MPNLFPEPGGRHRVAQGVSPGWVTAPLRGSLLCLLLLGARLAAQPGDAEQLYRAGVEAFRAGKTYDALELLGAIVAADPDYRDVQLLLGQACLVANLHPAAKKHFERTLETDPGNPHAAFLLGLTLYRSARWFEAAEALARARDLAPHNPHPLIYRGLSLLRLGRPDEARDDIEAALAEAEEPTARLALAELELAEGRFEEAEASARGVASSAGSLEATILLGRIVFEAGRPAEAVPILRRARDAAPRRSDVLYLLAQALLRSGETDAGRSAIERFQDLKALEERVRVLEAALKTDPGDLESRLRLIRLLLDNGRGGAAAHHLAVVHRQAPEDRRIPALSAQLERLRR